MLALKALLAGTGKPLGGDRQRRVDIAIDGKVVRGVTIPADQGDVVRQIDLSAVLAKGSHRVRLTDRSNTAAGYQVALGYHVPGVGNPQADRPLSIRLEYDKTELTVDQRVAVTATVTNHQSTSAPMVVLDLPVPAGFAAEPNDLAALVQQGTIAKYQLTPRSVIVYLRHLTPKQSLVLPYRLRATMPVKVTAPAARAYEYYDPSRNATSRAVRLTVMGKT